jgi:hypothetical protein
MAWHVRSNRHKRKASAEVGGGSDLAEKRERMNSAASTTTVMIAHFSGVISAQSCSCLLNFNNVF